MNLRLLSKAGLALTADAAVVAVQAVRSTLTREKDEHIGGHGLRAQCTWPGRAQAFAMNPLRSIIPQSRATKARLMENDRDGFGKWQRSAQALRPRDANRHTTKTVDFSDREGLELMQAPTK